MMIARALKQSTSMLLLLWVASLSCAQVGGAVAREERLAPMEMGGVATGAQRMEVLSFLGEPRSEKVFDSFIVLEAAYTNLIIGFDESDTVSELEARTSKACLLKRICQGATLLEMQAELGAGGYLFNVIGDVLYVNGDGYWGEVRLSAGRARSVRILCSP
jgi:hypothetical protein